ncbi:ATP-dependent DNA helicase [Trichonephila clavipes]|nr:ATP-dependent DNA helicase [Trichonephila clavipes]
MSASARARASQKYKSRLSLERGGYGPHTGTPLSGAERARRFRERCKADAARNFSAAANLASTSNTGVPVLMDVTNIGTLKYIEYLTDDEHATIYGTTEVDVEPQPSTSTRIRKRVRLWLEFPNSSMGQLCRVKAKPHVMCKRDVLDLKWTPIVTRAANISLDGNIKCRRNQFPVVSASAITIHKSQGGTFDEVVFNYDKSQQIHLVYVALSRVASIGGLYLTNDKDDFKFYHGRGSTAPTVKDIRDEYDRMANHRLPTLSMQARAFCKRDVLAERDEDQGGYLHRRRQLILIVSAFNAQSLVAHAGNIESDNILMNSDYMVFSETWMNCANTVMINDFELRASNNTALEHRTRCPSTSSELAVRVSAAGGSAIYRNLQSSTNCSEIIVNVNKSCGNSVLRKHNVGDICLVDVKVEDLTLFILGAVYIHPKASAEAVKLCLYQSLLPYSANLTKLNTELSARLGDSNRSMRRFQLQSTTEQIPC